MVFLLSWIISLLYALFNIPGPAPPAFDAIVVGAGAGGCPLAETLAQGGLDVLLVERGTATLPPEVANAKDAWDALISECAEVVRGVDGMALPVGNCLGGATTINLGLYAEETPGWIVEHMGEGFGTEDEILEAYEWVRERVASPTAEAAGSPMEAYIQEAIKTFENPGGFVLGSVDSEGSPRIEEGKAWRTYSTFNPSTGERRSANTILNLDQANLSLLADTEVTKILFDGDLGVQFARTSDTPRARCIRTAARGLFSPEKIICVREGGRIYVTAGTILSTALLLKSGVGPGMRHVDNKEVGENFSDKPLLSLSGNFKKSYNDAGQLSIGSISVSGDFVTTGGKAMTVLLEEFSYGVPGLFKVLPSWRNNIPLFARNKVSSDLIYFVTDFCQNQVRNKNPFFLCDGIVTQLENGCDKVTGISLAVSSPTSKGRVTLNGRGAVQVDGGYLSTDEDLEALGFAIRSSFQQLEARSDPVALQRPCDDPNDQVCVEQSCPDINAGLINLSKNVLSFLSPATADAIPNAPASFINPNFFEQFLASTDNNLELGKLFSEWIISGYHYCGTNSIGAVVDEDLKVKGAEGLYLADASVIPQTARVNTMATVLMVGRRAGVKFLQERSR